MLADVSRDSQAFDSRLKRSPACSEGVDQAHLREMSVDTGFNFRKAMADTLKVTPAQLSEMIKKGKITGEKALNALVKGMELMTGTGGAAYQHAEAQLKELKAPFKGHIQDLQDSFGKMMENFIQPIADSIFSKLTPAELSTAFDQFDAQARALGLAKGDPPPLSA